MLAAVQSIFVVFLLTGPQWPRTYGRSNETRQFGFEHSNSFGTGGCCWVRESLCSLFGWVPDYRTTVFVLGLSRPGGVPSNVWYELGEGRPSQHCILAPQGPHAVLLVSAWARVCVLGTWRVPSGLAPSAVGGEIIRANPRFARLRQIEVHPLAATFRERPSTGWS